MKSTFLKLINKLPEEKYIFWTTLIFFLTLLITNPSNKIIAVSFGALFVFYYLKVVNFAEALFFTFISSLFILTGKSYPIQLLPAGVFPVEIFPQGYFISLVVTATHFITLAMFLMVIRKLFMKGKKITLNTADVLLIIFYIFKILSALFGSKEPGLSLAFELTSIEGLVCYFYARLYFSQKEFFWKKILYLICAVTIFESILGFSQFYSKSPLYKNVEFQVNIEYYGNAVDESQFTFRPLGTFDHANSLGILLASISLLILPIVLSGESSIPKFTFLSSIVLLTATISRSAWIGFAGGLTIFLSVIYKKNKTIVKKLIKFLLSWRVVLIPVAIILCIYFVLPRAQNSLYSFGNDSGAVFFRKIQIQDALEIIKLHPIFGIGAVMSVYEGISLDLYTLAASVPLQVHNWYLNTALENGLPSLFAIIFFFIFSFKKLFDDKKNYLYNTAVAAAILSAGVAALFQPYINFDLALVLLSLTNGDNIKPPNVKENYKKHKK